jgi:hypothetical protein
MVSADSTVDEAELRGAAVWARFKAAAAIAA